MESTMEPNMGPVVVPGVISGSSIIRDLLNRIEEKLARNCDLRQSDAYSGYSFKVEITLQLLDVYPTTVAAEVEAGTINPQLPSAHIALGSEVVAEEPEPSLERPVDPDGVVETPVKEPRYYTPRNVQPRPLSK
jgi:hypothetical protein